MGKLSFDGSATGVVYGLLKGLVGFQDLFNTSNFVFCWDSNASKRRDIYPEYKATRDRKDYTKEEIEFDVEFRRQMKKLRTTYLSKIGFRNIFIQRGYESDDIIASVARDISRKEDFEVIIVARDKDLYQCIRHNVSMYDPQSCKIMTLQGFKKRYGIKPREWSMVKAIAGCNTDNVKGIKGIGEKTAIKYLKGKLKETNKKYCDIVSMSGIELYYRNLELVELPMKGTRCFQLQKDELSEQGWKEVTVLLGMKSLKGKMPFASRSKSKKRQ
jgi:DNA polymerase-1